MLLTFTVTSNYIRTHQCKKQLASDCVWTRVHYPDRFNTGHMFGRFLVNKYHISPLQSWPRKWVCNVMRTSEHWWVDSDDQYQDRTFKRADLYVPNVKGFGSQLGHVSPVIHPSICPSVCPSSSSVYFNKLDFSSSTLCGYSVGNIECSLHPFLQPLSVHLSVHPPSICSSPATDSADQDYKWTFQ